MCMVILVLSVFSGLSNPLKANYHMLFKTVLLIVYKGFCFFILYLRSFHTNRDTKTSSNQAGHKPKQKQPKLLAPEPTPVCFPRCKTFSSDLSLIVDAWCGVCSSFRLVSPFIVQKAKKKGRATVRIQSGRDLRKIVAGAESIPRLLFVGRDSDTNTDSSGWLLWVLWEKDIGMLGTKVKVVNLLHV